MTKLLKIVSISETKTDTRGRKYVVASFKGETYLGNMRITNNSKPLTRLLWDAFTDENGNKFSVDPLYTEITNGSTKVGDFVEGRTETFQCTQYLIDGKPVTTYSTVVFSNENGITVANRNLKQNKSSVIVGDEVTAPQNLEVSSMVN